VQVIDRQSSSKTRRQLSHYPLLLGVFGFFVALISAGPVRSRVPPALLRIA
jgi:hypothetical protein